MKKSKGFTILVAVLLALFMLTISIAAPILVRPFYYAHITPLGLEQYTGLSREAIMTAYDEMLDFCLGRSAEFSVGVLPWSPSGRDHFVDVRSLFLLDLAVLAVSLVGLLALFAVGRRKRLKPYRFAGRGAGFWAAAGLIVTLMVVAALAASDFDRAFTIFHRIFFPGKENWIFDWQADPVILLLPQVFFRNCAILIGGIMAAQCAVLIAADLKGSGQLQ